MNLEEEDDDEDEQPVLPSLAAHKPKNVLAFGGKNLLGRADSRTGLLMGWCETH